jgi:hypothetical protein
MIVDGKPRGGFFGPTAESKFNKLLDTDAQIQFTNMDTENLKKNLIRRFHASLAKQGIMDQKETILESCGVTSTLDLTTDKLQQLVDEFSGYSRQVDNARIRNLRSELLTICNKMGVYVNNTDWSAVNRFFLAHTKKLMYQMDEQDLVKARKQFNSILDWTEQKKDLVTRQKLEN